MWRKAVFHKSGKPRGWFRALAFSGKTPSGPLKGLVVKKNGTPRKSFQRWMNEVPGADLAVKRDFERTEEVPFRVEFLSDDSLVGDVLVLVLYCAGNRLSDLQQSIIQMYRDAGFRVLLAVNLPDFRSEVDFSSSVGLSTLVDACVVRQNVGFDFSAWSHLLKVVDIGQDHSSISFTNDSVLPVSVSALQQMRERINGSNDDAIFLTKNNEVVPHGQSYFFSFSGAAVARGALKALDEVPLYKSKEQLIHDVELNFSRRLEENGFKAGFLYSDGLAGDVSKNLTIHRWVDLLKAGFPFVKIQLISAGFVSLEDPLLEAQVGKLQVRRLKDHLACRASGWERKDFSPDSPQASLAGDAIFTQHGVQQAWNPMVSSDAIGLPFAGVAEMPVAPKLVTAIVHGYYVDVTTDILERLASRKADVTAMHFRFIVTTDSEEKARKITEVLRRLDLIGFAMVCENRGRDVAPFLQACQHLETEFVLHLHSKRSPHEVALQRWADYLFANLIPGDLGLRSISMLLEHESIGLLYPGHFKTVHARRNWGFNYARAMEISREMGLSLSGEYPLDFPTGTMFWARTSALKRLLDQNIPSSRFEPEAKQEDGTLAHAIERIIQFVAEDAGFKSFKLVDWGRREESGDEVLRMDASKIMKFLARPYARLVGKRVATSSFNKSVGEVYPVGFARSTSRRRRLNVLIPTAKPHKIYGGVSTAIKIGRQIFDQYPDADLRVIVTTDNVDRDSLRELSQRFGKRFVQARPGDESDASATVVDMKTWRAEDVAVRESDEFYATAWWTADLGFRLLDAQRDAFGVKKSLLYLIQDFEPGFYPWSDKYGLAEATYHRPDETVAILNSEELAKYFVLQYGLKQAYCLPFQINPDISSRFKTSERERIVLCYGRPSVDRNAFATIVEAVRLWQARQPDVAKLWQFHFAGEDFDEQLLREVHNGKCLGKLNLDAYGDLLCRASVGVSLMLSPHPSYPPLEMASAGLKVITNKYPCKDLSQRSENIVSLEYVSPQLLADTLAGVLGSVDLTKPISPSPIKDLESPCRVFSADLVFSELSSINGFIENSAS